jgi:hypothetical protein
MFITLANRFLRVGRHYYPWFDQLCVIKDNGACIIIFSPLFFFANIFYIKRKFITLFLNATNQSLAPLPTANRSPAHPAVCHRQQRRIILPITSIQEQPLAI